MNQILAMVGITLLISAAGATFYYTCTSTKTRTKHSIMANCAWDSVKSKFSQEETEEAYYVKSVSVQGLQNDLLQGFFHDKGEELKEKFVSMLPLEDEPMLSVLQAFEEEALIPAVNTISTCELTVHYSTTLYNNMGVVYAASWRFWQEMDEAKEITFPLPEGNGGNGATIIDAYLLNEKRQDRRDVMESLAPWLGPNRNFYCDVEPPSRRPNLEGLVLRMRAKHNRSAYLRVVDNRGKTWEYDLTRDATITPPASLRLNSFSQHPKHNEEVAFEKTRVGSPDLMSFPEKIEGQEAGVALPDAPHWPVPSSDGNVQGFSAKHQSPVREGGGCNGPASTRNHHQRHGPEQRSPGERADGRRRNQQQRG